MTRTFALMPFGGGGALHATALARELGMGRVVVPRYPGVLCASGLLSAMVEHEAAGGFVRRFAEVDPDEVVRICGQLAQECAARMREEGIAESAVETACHGDICYVGQAHHIEVLLDLSDPGLLLDRAYEQFCTLHDRVYGHSTRSPARFVNLRVVQRSANPAPGDRPAGQRSAASRKGARRILLDGAADFVRAEVFDRDGLAPGDLIRGPAIVEQADTTTLIEPGWQARVADNEVLMVTTGGGE